MTFSQKGSESEDSDHSPAFLKGQRILAFELKFTLNLIRFKRRTVSESSVRLG